MPLYRDENFIFSLKKHSFGFSPPDMGNIKYWSYAHFEAEWLKPNYSFTVLWFVSLCPHQYSSLCIEIKFSYFSKQDSRSISLDYKLKFVSKGMSSSQKFAVSFTGPNSQVIIPCSKLLHGLVISQSMLIFAIERH